MDPKNSKNKTQPFTRNNTHGLVNSNVLEMLTKFIMQSKIEVGERLPAERTLAEQLKVSRSSVREALRHWEVLNIVEKRKGSGTYLQTEVSLEDTHVSLNIRNTPEDMLLTMEIRRCLETQAAAIAATRASDQEIDFIENRLNRMERVHLEEGNAPAEDWDFHASIYQATQNPMFQQIIEGMFDAFHSFFEQPNEMGFASRSFRLHRHLFEAIAARNPDMAAKVTHEILDITEEDIKKLMKK